MLSYMPLCEDVVGCEGVDGGQLSDCDANKPHRHLKCLVFLAEPVRYFTIFDANTAA